MPVPQIVDDGNFTLTLQNGGMVWDSPLSDRGDFNHLVGRITLRVNTLSFKPSNHGSLDVRNLTTGDGTRTCYLVGMSPADKPGNNLMEWDLTYATLPADRIEYTSISYTQQWILESTETPGSFSIVEFTQTRTAQVTYNYFLASSPLSGIGSPRIEEVDGHIYSFHGWRYYDEGELVVAEDSKIERYLGDIYVRKTPRIAWIEALPITPDSGNLPTE